MTAEIAVMNRGGIALAADSAVTVTTEAGQKIYNTVNKLFTLSKYEPIAVMVYGSGTLMEVPWELIVKLYREEVGESVFQTVADAADHFLNWIADNQRIFPYEARREFAGGMALGYLSDMVRTSIDGRVEAAILESSGDGITMDDLGAICKSTIAEAHDLVSGRRKDPRFSKADVDEFMSMIDVPELIDEAFDGLPLDRSDRSKLRAIVRAVGSRLIFSQAVSGVVVAGFGEAQAFPAVAAYQVDGILGRRLKAELFAEQIIGETATGGILPFAQREMVDTFMSGVSPGILTELAESFRRFVSGISESVGASIPDETQALNARSSIEKAGSEALEELRAQMEDYQKVQFIEPVVSAIEVLPKEDLAEVAESLVNLTSFKRRVSIGEVESVGGPIDVAIISKGDGFVWIKRKHYFKSELNPQFFANYYR